MPAAKKKQVTARAKRTANETGHAYVLLLRGINVGGKNKMPMAELKSVLERLGCTDVTPYIQSGNVVLRSPLGAKALSALVESKLPTVFTLDSSLVKILVLTAAEMRRTVAKKPKGFGESPTKFHSDVIFLMDYPVATAMKAFSPKEGVDTVWSGVGVIYSQRLSAKRTQSRLNKVMGSPAYKSMTIRNWNTTTKLLQMVEAMQKGA